MTSAYTHWQNHIEICSGPSSKWTKFLSALFYSVENKKIVLTKLTVNNGVQIWVNFFWFEDCEQMERAGNSQTE